MDDKILDAVFRLTGVELDEGMSILVSKIPGKEGMQVLKLRLTSTTMEFENEHINHMGGGPTQFIGSGVTKMKFEGYVE